MMSAAMLTVPIADGIAKLLSTAYSPFFVSWARNAAACALALPLAAALHGRALFPRDDLPAHVLRGVFLAAAMTCFFIAVAQIPLATAVSAYFIGPIVAVALAAVVLREALTPRKLASLGLGVGGALVILQPGGDVETGVLWAFAAGLLYAFYLVSTRLAARRTPPAQTLALQCVVGTVALLPLALAFWPLSDGLDAASGGGLGADPLADAVAAPLFSTAEAVGLVAAMGVVSVLSHVLSIVAFRYAEASTLAPLVYLELISAALIGYLVFNELPGQTTLLGALLIVAAGLILIGGGRARPRALGP